jgi:DNA topoisomerase III
MIDDSARLGWSTVRRCQTRWLRWRVQLIVAEKPSVARDLARVLGVRPSGRSCFEGPHHVITWCVGHLVELEEPAAYDGRWKPWRLDALPMLPAQFRLRPAKHAAEQLRVVARLLRDRRFTSVVNACDAGREGELIFRYVYQFAGGGPPIQRLWISSLTDDAIRRGFATLRPGVQLDALGDAARSRSEADWLVGMNATRGITVRGRESGHDALYSIGRVQTPTLAMLVEREHAIRRFVPRDYWEIRGDFTTATGERFSATWRRIETARSGAPVRSAAAPSAERDTTRLGSLAIARAIVARDTEQGAAAAPLGPRVERVRARTVREPPPLLFDLTSLQRTANRRFGWSASRTLEVAQLLYERHKLVTYPRTDARHLTSDVARELPRMFAALAAVPDYAAFAGELLAHPPRPGRRVVDDAKVHDHHAIVPTGNAVRLEGLDRDEHRLFDLIARRFLGAFFPDAEFAVTEAWIRVLTADGPPPPFPSESRPSRDDARAPSRDDARAPSRDHVRLAGRGDSWVPSRDDAQRSGRDDSRVPTRDESRSSPGPERGPRGIDTARAPREGSAGEPQILEALPPPPDRYLARGRARMAAGWQAVAGLDATSAARRAGADADDGDQAVLPVLVEDQALDGAFSTIARQTRPPPRYTEATLLSAMESAGKVIDDEALRDAMKDCGLGTPATRAAIIETLLRRTYIVRDKQHLAPTAIGIGLIAALPVASLASPELTGTWEARLARIARGEETRAAFMADITRYVADLVEAIRTSSPPPPPPTGAPAQAQPRGRRWHTSGRRRSAGDAATRRPTRGTAARATRTAARWPGSEAPSAPRRTAPIAEGTSQARPTTDLAPSAPRRTAPLARGTSQIRPATDLEPSSPRRMARSAPRTSQVRAVDRSEPGASKQLAVETLRCPRCGAGTLITGARGWGCSRWRDGCRFVIWFETSGRRLTLAQLRDLVMRGRTRKARFGDQAGSLVLDGDAPRFEPAVEISTPRRRSARDRGASPRTSRARDR